VNLATKQWRAAIPVWGWAGLFLVAVCWPLNWTLPGMRTAYLFFPLWLGYILFVDALVARRSGTSLLNRSPRDFTLLFVASAPTWWLFELINRRTHNWEYLGEGSLSDFQYYLLCTLSFSTVMPAVFETAELFSEFQWVQRFRSGPRLPATRGVAAGLFVAGILMLALVLSWPKYFYPLVWLAVFFILDPINYAMHKRQLFDSLRQGDWRPIISLSAGALLCGFFWEMWNYRSFPKWIYHTPGAEFFHIFEMPLFGYFGYLPFAWELFALRNLLWPPSQPFKV